MDPSGGTVFITFIKIAPQLRTVTVLGDVAGYTSIQLHAFISVMIYKTHYGIYFSMISTLVAFYHNFLASIFPTISNNSLRLEVNNYHYVFISAFYGTRIASISN